MSFNSHVMDAQPTESLEETIDGRSGTFTLHTLEEIEGIMAGVARSIEALDAGTYGLCEHCAAPIAKQTLVDNPLVVRCEAHVVKERPVLFDLPTE